MQTRGTESICASAIPVTSLVAPGPLVAMATPTLPVTRASPSAANTAPCSCRVRICRTPLPSSASYNGMIAPPGYPNTRSTPSARTHRKTISAPLSIRLNPPRHLTHVILSEVCVHEVDGNAVEGPLARRRKPRTQQGIPTDALSIHRQLALFLRRFRPLLRFSPRQPAHHPPQLRPHNFNRMLLLFLPQIRKVVSTLLVLLDPLPRKRPILNVCQRLLHCRPRRIAYNFFATCQVAILRRIRNRMPHPRKPAFINQIDNQLHLMQTLKVS